VSDPHRPCTRRAYQFAHQPVRPLEHFLATPPQARQALDIEDRRYLNLLGGDAPSADAVRLGLETGDASFKLAGLPLWR